MKRALLTLLPPIALIVLSQVAHHAIFASRMISTVLTSGVIETSTTLTVLGFYLLRLFTIFVVPGWLVIVVIRLVRRARGTDEQAEQER